MIGASFLKNLSVPARAKLAGRKVLDIVLPPSCTMCAERLMEPQGICGACWSALEFIDQPLCDKTGLPFPFFPGEGVLSARALADPPDWDRARAAVKFDDASRGLVHALKYRDRHEAALPMARMMARAGRELLTDGVVLVPVPLYNWRTWKRRFNQSGLIAQGIGRISGLTYDPHLLVRDRPTRQQVGLDASERRRNVRNAFTVAPEHSALLAGRRIVLVDDVITTGATANACAIALKKAGVASVDVLSFALVIDPQRLHI